MVGVCNCNVKEINKVVTCESKKEEDVIIEKASKKVKVELEEELVESLPMMKLEDVLQCDDETYLVTFDGIVYDVTTFVKEHPGTIF